MRVVCSSEMIDKITVYDYIPYGKEPNHRLYIRKDKEYQLVKEYYFTKNPIIIENGEYVIKGYSSNEEEVIYSNTKASIAKLPKFFIKNKNRLTISSLFYNCYQSI